MTGSTGPGDQGTAGPGERGTRGPEDHLQAKSFTGQPLAKPFENKNPWPLKPGQPQKQRVLANWQKACHRNTYIDLHNPLLDSF